MYLENIGSGGSEGVSIKFNPMFDAESMIASNREGAFSNVSNLTFHTYSSSMAEAMRIDSTGKVGIGTTSPPEKLTVEGNISASGDITLDNTLNFGAATNNILTTNPNGNINITPSFTPGVYNQGDGKDLGHLVEFKSEVQLSLDLPKESQFGFSYNHLSNASLGEKNPGANSYMFNFLKKF